MKKFIGLLLAAMLAVATAQPVSAETTWIPLSSAGSGEGLVAIKELDHNGVSSRFSGNPGDSNTNQFRICADGPDSASCNYLNGKKTFYANQVLPLCKSKTEENCVVKLRTAAPGQELTDAELIREVDIATYEFEDLSRGLYRSGKPALFKAATTPAANGATDYSVTANVRMHFDSNKGKYVTSELELSVVPYTEVSGGEKIGLFEKDGCQHDEDGICIFGWGPKKTCAWEEQGKCGSVVAFTPESRFEVQVRVSKSIAGWFRGRIQRPDISVAKFSSSNNLITVSAEPTVVSRLEAKITKDNTTASQRALANKGGTTAGSPVAGCIGERLLCGNIAKGQSAMSPVAVQWVDAFRKAANDTAVANTTLWNLSTIDVQNGNNNRCLSDTSKVQGIVTTNATALDGTPPAFKNGTLSYNVAGLHYAPDGTTLNIGSYDLVMRSETARCLYGFSKAPLSATVSVVNEKGTKAVATTVVKETKDGWLKMAAYGFTFSKKTIKVKISKKK